MRTSFKHHQLRTMKQYFNLNHNPDAKDLKQLAQKTGLTKRVLQVWFQNARAKFRRSMHNSDGSSISPFPVVSSTSQDEQDLLYLYDGTSNFFLSTERCPNPEMPFLFVDVAGSSSKSLSGSHSNEAEAEVCRQIILALLRKNVRPASLAIIVFYKEQSRLLEHFAKRTQVDIHTVCRRRSRLLLRTEISPPSSSSVRLLAPEDLLHDRRLMVPAHFQETVSPFARPAYGRQLCPAIPFRMRTGCCPIVSPVTRRSVRSLIGGGFGANQLCPAIPFGMRIGYCPIVSPVTHVTFASPSLPTGSQKRLPKTELGVFILIVAAEKNLKRERKPLSQKNGRKSNRAR
ncbi:homeobox domain protein [Cooperia oncophora]